MPTQSKLPSNIKKRLSSYAGQLTSLARSFAPNHIAPTIHTTVTDEGEGVWRLRIKATAPDARAQEYGSGLHAQKGAKVKYPINPKNGKKLLAFQWDIATANPENFNFLPDGRVLLPSVMHPGIRAVNSGKGYIRPALTEFRKKIRSKTGLSQDVKDAILGDLRAALGATRKNNG